MIRKADFSVAKLNTLKSQVLADLTCDVYEFTHNPTKKQKVGSTAYVSAAMLLGLTTQVLAAPSGGAPKFFTTLQNMLDNLYAWILLISSSLAIALIAFRIVQYMAAGDPQAAKMAKDNIKRIIIAWVCINLLGALASVIQMLTKGNGWRNHEGTFQ